MKQISNDYIVGIFSTLILISPPIFIKYTIGTIINTLKSYIDKIEKINLNDKAS